MSALRITATQHAARLYPGQSTKPATTHFESPAKLAEHLRRLPIISTRTLVTVKAHLNRFSQISPSQLGELATVLQESPVTRSLWIQYVQDRIHTVVESQHSILYGSNIAHQQYVLDHIRDLLMLISPDALEIYAGLSLNPGKISRKVIVLNPVLDYAIVAFTVDGPGTVHNHKPKVVGVGVSLDDKGGLEHRFALAFPNANRMSEEYRQVDHRETIPQHYGTTLYELGEDGLAHQITRRFDGEANVRIHFYFGGGVGDGDGNPNDFTAFIRPSSLKD